MMLDNAGSLAHFCVSKQGFQMPHIITTMEEANIERVCLTEKESLHVLALLENPPMPNARLLAAAQQLPSE